MFEIGTQLWISQSHGYLEVCSKSPKVRDTDISLYIFDTTSRRPNQPIEGVLYEVKKRNLSKFRHAHHQN